MHLHEQQFFTFSSLALEPGLSHMLTTRHTFLEPDFNLSYHTGEEALVLQHRTLLKNYFKAQAVIVPKQVHGKAIKRITLNDLADNPADYDALVTNEKNVLIGVLSADCVPLIIYDTHAKVVGVAHAGWKGTVAFIGIELLNCMLQEYGCNKANIKIGIGPSICLQQFEVQSDVAQQFEALGLNQIVHTHGDKFKVDLWQTHVQLFQQQGIQASQIEVAQWCSVEHGEHFYSARREGFNTGRYGLFAMLN
jgi:YfiH family protein